MKFTLLPYQAQAVDDVLVNLKHARDRYRLPDKCEISSFSLTATTGAGKTVMAAAAIEALFWGNEAFDFEADAGAVVLWFSDDPSLNEQTRNRLMQASEKFTYANLVRIEPPFAKPRLDPGKVYFLNTQKLSAKSLLVRGHMETAEERAGQATFTAPDMQGWTIWETIANTIEDDHLTLYLILDEAHRGFNTKSTSDKPTIVRRLVNGTRARPPIPIVWGISATIQHFETAMKEAEATRNRRSLPPVLVNPGSVQESGLVKDTLVLDIPDEAGNFDSVLVRRAARKLKDSTERWRAYTDSQGLAESVQPLLVLQTPNTPNPDDVGIALDTVVSEYPELNPDQIRHVLGEHSTQTFGAWRIDWIEPQRVQEESRVRVLIAKDAISTGWDCPRAEVLVSFRHAKDNTHITQLLGRMVRSPLARRVPGDERLNAVDCILPFFDRTTAVKVVRFLTGELDEVPGSAKKVVLDGKELAPNPNVPGGVWRLWEALPTQTLPQRGARPVTQLVSLAQALSADRVRPGALKETEDELHRRLDGFALIYAKQLETAIQEIWDVHIKEISGKFGRGDLSYEEFIERADDRAIRTGFEFAKRAFGADIAQSYVDYTAGPDIEDSDGDGLREAYVRISALATVKEVREKIDTEAIALTEALFAEHRVTLKDLPDARQQEYEDIRAMATAPQRGSLRRPRTRIEGFSIEKDDEIVPAPLAPWHLMSDENGNFPLTSLNNWERSVVEAELERPGVCGWYRNPARAALDSLGIAYRDENGNWRSMHPDFLFFHETEGETRASIVDPHGHHLDDAAIKLKALAAFAMSFGVEFHRIEAIAEVDGKLRVLDMQLAEVRESALAGVQPAVDLYRSSLASDYQASIRPRLSE
ncbi:MAG TPA: DEAD/DEAH box helicase family protein [Nitrospira sp.]|nr:DEAD/DEAH box helicase family protein [Nitrospira sp.]